MAALSREESVQNLRPSRIIRTEASDIARPRRCSVPRLSDLAADAVTCHGQPKRSSDDRSQGCHYDHGHDRRPDGFVELQPDAGKRQGRPHLMPLRV